MDAVIIQNERRDCLNSFVFLLLFGTKEKKQENERKNDDEDVWRMLIAQISMAKSWIIIASAGTILSQEKPIFKLSNTMTSSKFTSGIFLLSYHLFCYRVPSSLYDNTNPDWGQSQNIGHDKVKILTLFVNVMPKPRNVVGNDRLKKKKRNNQSKWRKNSPIFSCAN